MQPLNRAIRRFLGWGEHCLHYSWQSRLPALSGETHSQGFARKMRERNASPAYIKLKHTHTHPTMHIQCTVLLSPEQYPLTHSSPKSNLTRLTSKSAAVPWGDLLWFHSANPPAVWRGGFLSHHPHSTEMTCYQRRHHSLMQCELTQ